MVKVGRALTRCQCSRGLRVWPLLMLSPPVHLRESHRAVQLLRTGKSCVRAPHRSCGVHSSKLPVCAHRGGTRRLSHQCWPSRFGPPHPRRYCGPARVSPHVWCPSAWRRLSLPAATQGLACTNQGFGQHSTLCAPPPAIGMPLLIRTGFLR